LNVADAATGAPLKKGFRLAAEDVTGMVVARFGEKASEVGCGTVLTVWERTAAACCATGLVVLMVNDRSGIGCSPDGDGSSKIVGKD